VVELEGGSVKKNLAMHVYPRRDPGHWRRGVEHVRQRLSQFTGRRLVSVAIDTSTDTAAEVERAFGGQVEIREVFNDGTQEMVSFPWLMGQLIDNSDDVTFYCHAKGCTHKDNPASHLWCDAMAAACLDYPALVGLLPLCGNVVVGSQPGSIRQELAAVGPRVLGGRVIPRPSFCPP
jgi:hypothetical protein